MVAENEATQISSLEAMDKLMKYAELFASSTIVPDHYRGKKGDIFVAVQSAWRMNLDPMAVMQGTYVVHGKLGMTSAFAISLANTSGLIESGISYDIDGQGNDLRVTAKATMKANGEEISYSIGMREAIAEGWTKNGKYKTMPELMLRYRAATLLIRTHIPQVLNGMHMVEEIQDVHSSRVKKMPAKPKYIKLVEQVKESGNEDIEKLAALVEKHEIPEYLTKKWCDAASVHTIEKLPEDKVSACIEYIEKKYESDILEEIEEQEVVAV